MMSLMCTFVHLIKGDCNLRTVPFLGEREGGVEGEREGEREVETFHTSDLQQSGNMSRSMKYLECSASAMRWSRGLQASL